MTVNFMDSATARFAAQGLGLALVLCIFCIQRFRWKHNQRKGKKKFGFYPTTYALGNAFQQLQLFVKPDVENILAEKLKEDAEEDDEGGTDDPAKHLERQLKRIRRGERIDRLTTILPDGDRRS
jgi:hypothetical protein